MVAPPSNRYLSSFLQFTWSSTAIVLLLPLLLLPCSAQAMYCGFETIYNFGDSISDTGNLLREGQLGAFAAISSPPYGQTYFQKPTGRCSDGLLMVDILAMRLHLPLLNPFLEREADFRHGVNFAVAGGTAVHPSFWLEQGVVMPYTNSSLDVQLDWFNTHLTSRCFSPIRCAMTLKKALFLVGEIGGNDYNYAFFQGKSIEEVTTYVPRVVQTIKDAARKLIDVGAIHLVVPGNFPIGCMPIYLTLFGSNDPASYDENKCLKNFNEFAMVHNHHLQQAIEELREEYPRVLIAYADYYDAMMGIITHAAEKGFEKNDALKACCGSGGAYNFDMVRMCGAPGVPVCPNPEKYIHWDGIHLTQEAYTHIAVQLFSSIAKQWKCSPLEFEF